MNRKYRILIVDDEEQILFVLREALSKLGEEYEILTASNGHEALARLREIPIDLLVTDLIMPGMDGVALTEVAYAMFPNTKVIWMTSYDRREDDAQRLSVQRYLLKPLNIDDIRKVVIEEAGLHG